MAAPTYLSAASVAELQSLLEQEYGRPFTFSETEAIGRWLLEFYSELAKDGNSIGLQK